VHGTFTLFGQVLTAGLISDASAYTFGVQFKVTTSGVLNGIWFYSGPGAGVLPTTIALYSVSGGGSGTLVHSEVASWSGALASGWVLASFASPPSLTAGQAYKGCVFSNAGIFWYSAVSHYWDTGAGSGGITSGSLVAPNNAGADGGQDTFTTPGPLAYPATSFNAANYLVDVKVTT
jgi:hypothetical protein